MSTMTKIKGFAKFIRLLRRSRNSGNINYEHSLHLYRNSQLSYCSWYHSSLRLYVRNAFNVPETWEAQSPILEAVAAFHERYRRFCHYVTETRHDWQFVRNVYYADNSTAVVERSRLTGETRERETCGPGGDLCF